MALRAPGVFLEAFMLSNSGILFSTSAFSALLIENFIVS